MATGFKGKPDKQSQVTAPGQLQAYEKAKETGWRKSVRQLQENDAFALRDSDGLPDQKLGLLLQQEKRSNRLKCLVLAVLTLALALSSLCISYDGSGTSAVKFYNPGDVLNVLVTAVQLWFAQLAHLPLAEQSSQIIGGIPIYNEVLLRGGLTLVTLGCGLLLAVSGMLYQNVFRNPIASPSLLGVSDGVSLGLLLLVLQFGNDALLEDGFRYLYCYVLGIVILLATLLLGRVLGRGKGFNVFDMLLVGTVVSQLIGVITTYALNSGIMTSENWDVYYQLQEALRTQLNGLTVASMAIACLVAMIPVVLFRFKMNLLPFSDADAKMSGVNPNALRIVALVCGSIMIMTAQINVGAISVFALVIPFLARKLFGMEFRKQLWGNVLLGMFLLLLCRNLCDVIPFVGSGIPLGTMVSFVTLPLFVWMMTFQRKTW